MTHRILWSVPFGALLIFLRRQWPDVIAAFKSLHILKMLTLSALIIALNWLIYVWAVVNDNILEASLGYFINPLFYVAVGVVILGERLNKLQATSVFIATIGVLILTIGTGTFPLISFALAVTFTAYGYFRKTTNVGALPGLFIEVVLLSPIALIYLLYLKQTGQMVFLSEPGQINYLLILAGPVTVVPLVLFAIGARNLQLSTLGFLQYIGPSLQFLLGLYFGEAFTLYHGICFGLIWVSLAIFTMDKFRHSPEANA